MQERSVEEEREAEGGKRRVVRKSEQSDLDYYCAYSDAERDDC